MKRAAVRAALRSLAFALALHSEHTAAQERPATGHAYTIEARLDPDTRTLEGRVRIAFRNHSDQPLRELVFHLYPNAFESNDTVFMREGGAAIRGGTLRRKGGLDLHALTLTDGTDLLARAERELVPRDRTQLRTALPAELAPGASLAIEARFTVRLPSLLARMGSAGDFFMIAQFFPKLARLEPDGTFASFPYHGLGEFYADFADYEISIDVPENYVVAAPGALVEQRALPDERRLERYRLPHALDIAFAADPRMRRVRIAGEGGVVIDAYAPAGQLRLARRQAELLRDGLAYFSARLGPYPQRRLVLVLPPREGLGAAGMEYPGLVTGWIATPFGQLNPAAELLHDIVTAHELAHQWFPMLVATNEAESPLLDEGLAEWLGLDLVRERLGGRSTAQRLLGLPIDPFDGGRLALVRAGEIPSSLLPAWGYDPHQLPAAVYLRPALALETFARTWSRERLWSALGRYARAHRFGHPGLGDLLYAFDVSYYPGFSQRVLVPLLEGQSAATRLARAGGAALRATRAAAPALPHAIEVAYARGGPARSALASRAQEQVVPLDPAREAIGAAVDPDLRNLLDPLRRDDQLRLSPDAPRPPLVARLLLGIQALLGALGP